MCQCQWNLRSFWRLERIQVKRHKVSRLSILSTNERKVNDRAQILPQSPREIYSQVLPLLVLGRIDILNWPWTKYSFCTTLAQIQWSGKQVCSLREHMGDIWVKNCVMKQKTSNPFEKLRPRKWSLMSESLVSLILSDLVEFTDEEGYGRYLDLHDCYLKYINLKASEVGPVVARWERAHEMTMVLILGVGQDGRLGLLDREQLDYLPCVLWPLRKYKEVMGFLGMKQYVKWKVFIVNARALFF